MCLKKCYISFVKFLFFFKRVFKKSMHKNYNFKLSAYILPFFEFYKRLSFYYHRVISLCIHVYSILQSLLIPHNSNIFSVKLFCIMI